MLITSSFTTIALAIQQVTLEEGPDKPPSSKLKRDA
jgi:hypothetical protein